ncbi:2-dehydro-3-deoxyglucarate aldolase [soil metagenome]
MSTSSPIRQRVLARETTFGAFLVIDSPATVEICARSGLDWVLIDLEHGMASEAGLVPLLMATSGTPAAALVRVESGARPRVGRVLDMGAEGVMVPQIHSAAEARSVARWLRTQPGGERGVALFTRGMDYGGRGHDGAATRHEDLLGIVQIESTAALAAVDEMAEVEGVDVLFVGPTDLSHALGIPGRIEAPVYDEAIRRVAGVARNAGKAAGVLVWRPEDTARYAELGYTFFGLSSEGLILDRALRSALEGARGAARAGAPA